MKPIGFISCSSLKRQHPCPAREMYVSPLFKMSRRLVELHTSRWFILSAKYGVLEPDQLIHPYDVTLLSMSKAARALWAEQVGDRVKQLSGDNDLVVLAGRHYMTAFQNLSNKVIEPLFGLEIGDRLKRLKLMGA